MVEINFIVAAQCLARNGHRWPFFPEGDLLATLPDKFPLTMTEKEWEMYPYNPPGYISISTLRGVPQAQLPDPGATEKPTWAALVAAASVGEVWQYRRDITGQIANEETRRIINAYIGDQKIFQTVEQEILYRLRATAADLAAKDTERNRLAGKARALRTWINDDARTLAELEAFDATADSHWEKDE